ncbi:tyrosine-type recombinase/integrase [Paraburkholderia sabiae]|uniref:Tyrosine-type recombinase/integrase n=1 Tax=Paraburkholderia sabiae TaxID=273251 RepID=A0ABU9QD32_9BURK|nr:tyrosine-type recombinase/integrase [Paraburkholderia sabiae]WJZ76153.1 tyrosine-type recombinase/integrase [Paraburkholderia sabiae]CAD6526159.1 Prophage integrase IntS [Paraburkholderia sabiae]
MTATLTHAHLLAAKPKDKPYKVVDDHSLYLYVPVSGKRKWKFDFRIGGKTSTITLGDFPAMTLKEARTKRDAARELVKDGINPLLRKEQLKQDNIKAAENTVYSIVKSWFDAEKIRFSDSYRDSASRYIERYLNDTAFGNLPARDVKPAQVSKFLQSIAVRNGTSGDERKKTGAPHVAVRVRSYLDGGFRRAITQEIVEHNPVSALRFSDVAKLPETRNNTALDDINLKRLIASIGVTPAKPLTKLALRLLLLTATRTVEVREARWQEFDFKHAQWTVPGGRMKMKKSHIVPLSHQAITVLKQVKELTKRDKPDDFVFPNERDPSRPLSHAVINKLIIRAGFGEGENWFRAHGFRGTFATWADENNFTVKAVDRALAHVEKNQVRRAYSKAQLLPERQKMMQTWADFLQTIGH